MSTIGKLFGRSPFGQIQLHMNQVARCVDKMNEALDAVRDGKYSELDRISQEVSELEHQADEIKTDLRNRLLRRFFMPIDRAEVLEIVSLQDSLGDTAEDVCKVLTFKDLPVPDEVRSDFEEFKKLNLDAFNIVHEIINQLDELIESGFGGPEGEKIRSLANDAAFAEHRADVVQVDLLKKLYALDSTFSLGEFSLWMRVTRILSRISNISENLANRVLKTLSLK
ncbi:MAG: TIGR00153 family protein [Planctomycetota bacterium]